MATMDVSILDLLTKAGPYALFILIFFIWQLERKERLDAQERERNLVKEFLQTNIRTTNALRSLRYILMHGKVPQPEDYEAEDV